MATTLSDKPSLRRVTVTNWGPIKNADITLGSCTFVVGAQNTGKTYLAQLILILSKFMVFVQQSQFPNAIFRSLQKANLKGNISAEAVAEIVEKNASEVAGYFKENVVNGKEFLEQLMRTHYLVTNATDLIRQGQGQSTIRAEFTLGPKGFLDLTFTMERSGTTNLNVEVNPQAMANLIKQQRPTMTLIGAHGWALSYEAPGPITEVTKYIPAERFVVLPVLSQLIGLLLTLYQGLTQQGALQSSLTQLAMRESFKEYLTDVNTALTTPASYKLMKFGQLEVVNHLPYFSDATHNIRLPISSAGSGVAQLAGIVLIVERTGANFLIIEEPEVNLHADAQLEVGDYLGNLSSKRDIFITTHSQYLMMKLAILHASSVVEDLRGYYIDPASGEAKPIEISKKTGDIELPESIERALETISKDAMALSKQFFGTQS